MQVSARISRETQDVELFFYEGRDLMCYAHVGQHSPASVEYMRSRTRPADLNSPEVLRLFNEWRAVPGGLPARLVHRLTRSI